MVIDEAMQCLFNQPYDASGNTAAKGKLIIELVNELKQDPYIVMAPPKTTGREVYGSEFTHDILSRSAQPMHLKISLQRSLGLPHIRLPKTIDSSSYPTTS